jgi:hypothetical protein
MSRDTDESSVQHIDRISQQRNEDSTSLPKVDMTLQVSNRSFSEMQDRNLRSSQTLLDSWNNLTIDDAAAVNSKKGGHADRVSKGELEGLAGETLKDDKQRAAFLKNIEEFEKRAKTDGLSQEEKERFYSQVKDVLEAGKTGNKFFDGDSLKTIASDMMKEAAYPGSVNQGPNPTCTAAALQSALFKAEPASIGALVRDLALTGQCKTADGSIITPNPNNLKPDRYQGEQQPYSRNSVDQLAQIGLLNVFWQRQAGPNGDNRELVGKIKYEEGYTRERIGDDRTRLMNYSSGKPQPLTQEVVISYPEPKRNPGDPPPMPGFAESVPMSGPRILNMANVHDMYSQLRGNHGNLKVISDQPGDTEPVFKPGSEKELQEFIERAKKENHGVMPAMVLGVFTDVEPFNADHREAYHSKDKDRSSGSDSRSMHAHHAVALFDVDPAKRTASVENQWGDNVDHTGKPGSKPQIALGDLFSAIHQKDMPQDQPAAKKEESPEEHARKYAKEYKEFVKELEHDPSVDREVVARHKEKLAKYVESWQIKE